jgi:hypothetical protein
MQNYKPVNISMNEVPRYDGVCIAPRNAPHAPYSSSQTFGFRLEQPLT